MDNRLCKSIYSFLYWGYDEENAYPIVGRWLGSVEYEQLKSGGENSWQLFTVEEDLGRILKTFLSQRETATNTYQKYLIDIGSLISRIKEVNLVGCSKY